MLRTAFGAALAERLVAYSCKRRGFCPSCAAQRLTESAALLVDEVLPPAIVDELQTFAESLASGPLR